MLFLSISLIYIDLTRNPSPLLKQKDSLRHIVNEKLIFSKFFCHFDYLVDEFLCHTLCKCNNYNIIICQSNLNKLSSKYFLKLCEQFNGKVKVVELLHDEDYVNYDSRRNDHGFFGILNFSHSIEQLLDLIHKYIVSTSSIFEPLAFKYSNNIVAVSDGRPTQAMR